MQYTLHDGERLVKAARHSIELYLSSPKFDKRMIERHLGKYSERNGVFVTIEHYPTMELRGCIGFPNAVGQVKSMIVDAAIAAATEDPRFVSMSKNDLADSVIEVSILSNPELIEEKSESGRLNAVKVGRDGLIIRYGFDSGLLLPVVPVEQGWEKRKFLENVCIKAGLEADSWKKPEINLYKFTAQVFKESSPDGAVKEVQIG